MMDSIVCVPSTAGAKMSSMGATDIIYARLVSDESSAQELKRLLRGCSSLASKAVVVERYCAGTLNRSLRGPLQVQVVPNLMAEASWTELASRLDGRSYQNSRLLQ
jgi:hypothetical protein